MIRHTGIPAYQHGPDIDQGTLRANESFEGETIEQRVAKIMQHNEPITDGAPAIYTDRQDGVIPEYNPRDDKWDRAIDMTDQIQRNKIAERKARQDQRADQGKPSTGDKTVADATKIDATAAKPNQNQ